MGDAFASIYRVLKKGGTGFLAMREGEGEKQEPETGRWFSYYSEPELKMKAENAGFTILQNQKKPSRPGLTWLTLFIRKP